jgi:capsular polysaccharide biosynthesis protein
MPINRALFFVIVIISAIVASSLGFYAGQLASPRYGEVTITRLYTTTYTSMVTQQIMVTPTMIQTYTQVPSREQLLAPIVEEARKEGKLVIYSTLDRPSAEPLLNAFRSKYSFINI